MKPGQTMWHEKYLYNGKLVKSKGVFYYCHKCQSAVVGEHDDTTPYCLKCFFLVGGPSKKPWITKAIELVKLYPSKPPMKEEGWSVFKQIGWTGVVMAILKSETLNKTPKIPLSTALEDFFAPCWIEAYKKKYAKVYS